MLNPRHRSEQGSGRCASLEEESTLCVFFGVFLGFAADSCAFSSPSSSSSSSPPPACSFGSMAFLFAADSCAFTNFKASQGTITECADLNYSISTQAQQLKQHTISINLICKYQLHASITLFFWEGEGGGEQGRDLKEKPPACAKYKVLQVFTSLPNQLQSLSQCATFIICKDVRWSVLILFIPSCPPSHSIA